ncbi:hypothetical protein E2C01_018519 [Portunus trituberculatus]|uniref:Uncharacterized protein n=1 Tax=Portunus trituberculatus TaxID=210409 RepID=A0A5B7DVC7_PORTR|nr:hypothetical protein [Portunus trituberculatus]
MATASPPPDAPQPIHATRHTNVVIPLRAPRTDHYHHSAIPSMVTEPSLNLYGPSLMSLFIHQTILQVTEGGGPQMLTQMSPTVRRRCQEEELEEDADDVTLARRGTVT